MLSSSCIPIQPILPRSRMHEFHRRRSWGSWLTVILIGAREMLVFAAMSSPPIEVHSIRGAFSGKLITRIKNMVHRRNQGTILIQIRGVGEGPCLYFRLIISPLTRILFPQDNCPRLLQLSSDSQIPRRHRPEDQNVSQLYSWTKNSSPPWQYCR